MTRPFGYCGNDYGLVKDLDRAVLDQIESATIGNWLLGLEMIRVGAAIENMWLAAEALGVRVAFMGDVVIAEDDICRVLGIGGDLVGVLALGFSDIPLAPRRQSLDEQDAEHVVWHEPVS